MKGEKDKKGRCAGTHLPITYNCLSTCTMITYNLKKVKFTKKIIKEYEETENFYISSCPCCNSEKIIKWGSYTRNVIYYKNGKKYETTIKIKRIKCKDCGHTQSIIPNFWVPYKVHIVEYITEVLKDEITSNNTYQKTIHQRCIVHIIRNMCKYVPNKQRSELCNDLKSIYKANTKEETEENAKLFRNKWTKNTLLIKRMNEYENSMLELFAYSENIRKLIYTTNAIESVNSCLRKVTNGKGCFVNKVALEKVLYLRIQDLEKKWKRTSIAKWPLILNEMIELFGNRIEKYIKI